MSNWQMLLKFISMIIYWGKDFFYSMTWSGIISTLTGIFIGWQAWETRKLAKLTIIKDQPLLEVQFPNEGTKIQLKNIGQSPAYSPSISSIEIKANEHLDFDPLHACRQPIFPGENREVWMHHLIISTESIGGFVESSPILKNFLIEKKSPVKITVRCFDKDGVKIQRNLYVRVSVNQSSGGQQIYTTTTLT